MEHLSARNWIRSERRPRGFEIHVLSGSEPLGLRFHAGEWRAAVRRSMSRSGAEVIERGRVCRFTLAERAAAEDLLRELDEAFDRISRKGVGHKITQELLGISSAERLRWSKDGRLQRRGSAEMTNGRQTITLWAYCPLQVEWLSQNPATIAQWREEDRTTDSLA